MPVSKGRPPKGARLHLRRRSGRAAVWVILDGGREIGTGCGESEHSRAEAALARHLTSKYAPPAPPENAGLGDILIADVVTAYLREHAPRSRSADWIAHMATPVVDWWGARSLADIRGQSCRDYIAWRVTQMVTRSARVKKDGSMPAPRLVSESTARHELTVLRAAIRHWHAEHGPLPAVPVVTLPAAPPPRERYLTRKEAAAMIRAARRSPVSRHLARLLLIGIYTGTRSAAILALQWLPNTTGGWIDLEAGVIHRRASGQRETRKRQPPLRIPDRLVHHLRRWKAADQAHKPVTGADGKRRPVLHVVHHFGRPIRKLRRSFATAAIEAGLGRGVTPHICRHTAATWLMQGGGNMTDIAGFLGMSIQMLQDVYGHHHPDFQGEIANARRGRRAGTKPDSAHEMPMKGVGQDVKQRHGA